MSRVYPQRPSPSSPSPYMSSKLESFTIWMKSLVFNTHGCTVYNSKGEIIYRVDNYDNKCGQEVYLMDIRGNVLYSLRQKKLRLFGCWDGYKWDDCSSNKQLWFHATKHRSICVNSCEHKGRGCTYKIVRMNGKLGFKIVDEDQECALKPGKKCKFWEWIDEEPENMKPIAEDTLSDVADYLIQVLEDVTSVREEVK
ncbi:unnamed protein product [Lactuca virosa]|uniref:Uncharacterized protein n=1 Tax=Lactuca virosa TaxID=75947 RepID=A0AAU9PM14_9ASTR|nr:unnamed protein product [Lactuca virosa]